MTRGPRKHLKRIAAPAHWCLDKLGGIYAPRPSCGPHRLRECVPLILLLRNRLKYALTYNEAKMIAMQRCIKIDGKVRTDTHFPCGFQDVITIEKTNENFRMIYDTKGRFVPHRIHPDEAQYKLCRVRKIGIGLKGIPYGVTHDGRTIRYIHPEIKTHDTLRVEVATGKILDFVKFDIGRRVMITGGHNIGRVGTIVNRERHPGGQEIVHVKDSKGNAFATRIDNVFVIGSNDKLWITITRDQGIRRGIIGDRELQLKKRQP